VEFGDACRLVGRGVDAGDPLALRADPDPPATGVDADAGTNALDRRDDLVGCRVDPRDGAAAVVRDPYAVAVDREVVCARSGCDLGDDRVGDRVDPAHEAGVLVGGPHAGVVGGK